MDVAFALRAHRVGVTGHAGLARYLRSFQARFGEHRHPAQQKVRRLESLAGADEGSNRRCDHTEHALAREGVSKGLLHQTEAATGIVVGDSFGADAPTCSRRIMIAQVLADARQRVNRRHAEIPQALRLADAGQFQ